VLRLLLPMLWLERHEPAHACGLASLWEGREGTLLSAQQLNKTLWYYIIILWLNVTFQLKKWYDL